MRFSVTQEHALGTEQAMQRLASLNSGEKSQWYTFRPINFDFRAQVFEFELTIHAGVQDVMVRGFTTIAPQYVSVESEELSSWYAPLIWAGQRALKARLAEILK